MISGNVIILVDKNFKLDFIKKTIEKFKPNYIYAPLGFFNKLEGLYDKKIQIDDYRLFGTKNKKIAEMDFIIYINLLHRSTKTRIFQLG